MRKAIAIVIQIIILTAAVFTITNIIEDNTYFGLIYGDITESIRWVMLGAMVLSVVNILIWWPPRKVTSTPNEAQVTSVKAEEAKADPIIPKMD